MLTKSELNRVQSIYKSLDQLDQVKTQLLDVGPESYLGLCNKKGAVLKLDLDGSYYLNQYAGDFAKEVKSLLLEEIVRIENSFKKELGCFISDN